MFKHKKGQSTVEYILLVTAVVAVMILFTTNSKTGLQKKMDTTIGTTINEVSVLSGRLNSTHDSPLGDSASKLSTTTKFDPRVGYPGEHTDPGCGKPHC